MSIESPPERYRRRRRWPIIVAIVVFLAAGEVLWLHILKPPPAAATGCNQPGKPTPTSTKTSTRSTVSGSSGASGSSSGASTTRSSTATSTTKSGPPTTLGTFVAISMLGGVRPADPANVEVNVFNASTAKGLAGTVTQDLRSAGFSTIAAPADDPLYPAQDLICASEIRFGQAGLAQARTVLIVAPCAQLVMDNRVDSSVDLALGTNYSFVAASAAMKAQLLQIHQEYIPPAVIEGQTEAARTFGPIPALPNVTCTPTGPLVTDQSPASGAAGSSGASAPAGSAAESAVPGSTTPVSDVPQSVVGSGSGAASTGSAITTPSLAPNPANSAAPQTAASAGAFGSGQASDQATG